MSISIVFEDNHLVVVNKPAGLATMGTALDEPSLARDVQAYLKHQYNKPGNVYLGVVSRLDTVTSGLVVFAKTSKAAARLTTQFRERTVDKWYLAAVPTVPLEILERRASLPASIWYESAQVCWEDWVWKDDAAHRMRVRRVAVAGKRRGNSGESGESGEEGQLAKLAWRLLGRGPDFDLVLIRLMTGRKHQIRVQFADRGFPILGDRKYGSRIPFGSGIALHSWRLELLHPITKIKQTFFQDPPGAWSNLESIEVERDVPGDPKAMISRPAALLKFLTSQLRAD